MKAIDVVRGWKDEEYRAGLSVEERTLLPEHPAGTTDISGGRSFPVLITLLLPITYQGGYTSTLIDSAMSTLTKVTITLIK